MKTLAVHIKTYTLRGFWAVIPLALSFFAIRLIYVSIDQRVLSLINRFWGLHVPGLGLLLLILTLYLIGIVASNFAGRQALGLLERISARIPLINTIYRVGRQLASTFTMPEGQVFRRPVLVNYLKTGTWTIGFVTGKLLDHREPGVTFLKVYVPTPPNPTSGFIVIVRESETRDPGWTVDEAMQVVISAGLIGPAEIQ